MLNNSKSLEKYRPGQQRDKDTKIGPFKIYKEYVYETKDMCKITEDKQKDIQEGDLTDIEFSEVDISNAIDKLKKTLSNWN